MVSSQDLAENEKVGELLGAEDEGRESDLISRSAKRDQGGLSGKAGARKARYGEGEQEIHANCRRSQASDLKSGDLAAR